MQARCHYELRLWRRGRFFERLFSSLRRYGAFESRAQYTRGDTGTPTKRQRFPRGGISTRIEEASREVPPPSVRPRGESTPDIKPTVLY